MVYERPRPLTAYIGSNRSARIHAIAWLTGSFTISWRLRCLHGSTGARVETIVFGSKPRVLLAEPHGSPRRHRSMLRSDWTYAMKRALKNRTNGVDLKQA